MFALECRCARHIFRQWQKECCHGNGILWQKWGKNLASRTTSSHENWWKTEEVVRDARFFPNFCHNMPLPWQHTFYHFQKMCLAHLHPKANICAKFHENWWKTEEVVRDARFSPHFCHNMPLPWQHTFYHCQKMCLAHLHPKANICAKFVFHQFSWNLAQMFALGCRCARHIFWKW